MIIQNLKNINPRANAIELLPLGLDERIRWCLFPEGGTVEGLVRKNGYLYELIVIRQ